MIRNAKFADIHAIARFLLECHTRTHFAKTGEANMDEQEIKRLLMVGMQRHGHKGIGACFIQVAENDGNIDGLVYGTLTRVYAIYDRLSATDLFWVTGPHAKPSDAMSLMKNMLAWARSCPLVIEVKCGTTAIINEDFEKAGRILKRLGMTPYGAIHRLDCTGEAKCQDSSAQSRKYSLRLEQVLPS